MKLNVRPALVLAFGIATLASPATVQAKGLGSLFSCDAAGSANTKAAVVGGLVGALAGSQIAKDDRALGAAIGAGLGAAIGNSIGCKMDRKARLDAEQAFQRALDTGRAQSWSDPQSGATGRVEVLESGVGAGSGSAPIYAARWRFADGVSPATRVSNEGGAFAATGRVNVRAAPNANAPVVDRLQPGEVLQAAGAAAGGWLAIQDEGLIQGYVSRSVVRPLDADGRGGDCRRVLHTIREPGRGEARERYTACRDANGAWSLSEI